jgi:hypothetical protein
VPGGVSAAAVAEAGDVADEDLVGAEGAAIRATRWWVGDPPSRPSSAPVHPNTVESFGSAADEVGRYRSPLNVRRNVDDAVLGGAPQIWLWVPRCG